MRPEVHLVDSTNPMLPLCLVPLVFAIFGQVMVFRSLLVHICFHFCQQPRPTYLLTIDHCDSFNVLKAFVGLINVDIKWFSNMGAEAIQGCTIRDGNQIEPEGRDSQIELASQREPERAKEAAMLLESK